MSRTEPRTPRRGRGRGEPSPTVGVDALTELLEGQTPASRTFIAGLIAGALVGAVVAGGQLLRRRVGRA